MEKLSPESTTSKDKTPKEKPSGKDKPEGQKGKVIVKASPIKKMNSATQPFASTKDEMALKEKYLKSYTKPELIKKSVLFSLRNWKYNVYNQINGFVGQFFSIYLPLYHARIIDAITKTKDYNLLYDSFKTYIFFLLLKLITTEGMQLLAYLFIRDSVFSYRNIVMENIAEKDIEFFDLFKTGELIERIRTSEFTIENNFLFKTISIAQTFIKFCFIVGYLLKYSKSLTIAYVILFIIKFCWDYLLSKFTEYRNHKRRMQNMDLYSNYLNEFITNIRLIKSFSTEKNEIKRLQELKLKCLPPLMGVQNFLFKVSEFIHQGSDTIILFIAGTKTISGEMTYGDLVVFQNYSNQLKGTFNTLQRSFEEYTKLFEGWTRFFEIYDYKPKIVSRKNLILDNLNGEIEFDNVSFAYPLKPEVTILKELSFTIKPGKVVAIVGHSGSGKTTISNLIQRFYDPIEGCIKIDGHDMRDFNITWLRKQIGFVAQEPALYSGSIEDNITYGVSEYTQEHFDQVCKLANINTFVEDKNLFPSGYKTLVGERGNKVSGGQKQRIAIARALMKDVKFLVFDEATSALDAESENEVQSAIDNIIKTKKITTVIIAHRLSTIKNADMILFLSKGKIIEKGTHNELIELNGEYKNLVQRQLVD